MSTTLAHETPVAQRAVPTVIDVEASGFGKGSYPIEVGFVLPDGRSDCMLIQPDAHWTHWDPAAEHLHRITRTLLASHGRAIRDVVERLNRQLEGRIVYTDGWGNDFTWLSVLHDAAERRPSYRLDSLQKLLSQDELARWDRTKAQVQSEATGIRHRASADARLLQNTVVRLFTGDGRA
jgi:hypothetical protein